MKLCLAFITLCFSMNASAHCEQLQKISLEMNLVSSNIANVDTTRTPEGGAYKRKELVNSEIVELEHFIDLYQPNHIDADEYGYVTYPDISIDHELARMLELSREYVKIYTPSCPVTKE